MELRRDIINKLFSHMSVSLIAQSRQVEDLEYAYILNGLPFYIVVIGPVDERIGLEVYDKQIATFFEYDFLTNANSDEQVEAVFLHSLKEEYIKFFREADDKGYSEFVQRVEDNIRPYSNTDARVTQTIWKLIKQYTIKGSSENEEFDKEYIRIMGYKNGCLRKVVEIISEHPDMFFHYPDLLIKHKAIDHSKSYYFIDVFWSSAAYKETLKLLAGEFLSEDRQTWIYRQKGNKTAFIALFEELYVKDYLKKRVNNTEIKNIALNSFNIEISERTFNEGPVIIQAQKLFKFLPVHMRYLGEDEATYNEIYKRR
jgi:hypothetical protein